MLHPVKNKRLSEITLPFNYSPRTYQLPLFKALDNGFKRAVCIWHRRAGKDKTFMNVVAKKMFERVGAYYYFYPTYAQGKKALWNNRDRNGFRFIDHIPPQLRKRIDNSEMIIETINGSLFQVIGTDNINSVVGTNPVGVVLSEYSLQNPTAWDYIRPILAENDGWAIFNYTPRGNNHGKQLYLTAKKNPEIWFSQLLTVDDTGAISKESLEQERREMHDRTGNDALYLQEYYCSFDAPIEGAYYATQMLNAEQEHRITSVPWEPTLPVETIWDLGIGDSMAIWFRQLVGKEIHYIDFIEGTGKGMLDYWKYLKEKPYLYGNHYAPHDIQVRELMSGKSRFLTAQEAGLIFHIVDTMSVDNGIDLARLHIPKCWFDATKCEKGINALNSYHKEFDEKNKVYHNTPKHDWASHGADAFRYAAISYREVQAPLEIVGYEEGLGGAQIPIYNF